MSQSQQSQSLIRLLEWLDRTVLQTIIARNLGFAESAIPTLSPLTIKNEILRVALWSKYSQENERKRVYILSLLRTAQQLAAPFLGEQASYGETYADELMIAGETSERSPGDAAFDKLYDFHRESLDELEILGDIAELPGGYWLPAPLRVVALPDIQRWLVVGGLPLSHFPQTARQEIDYGFAARLLKHDPASLGLSWPIQALQSWCRKPSQPLEEWTRQALSEAVLSSAQDLPANLQCEYYHPSPALSRAYQYSRWEKRLWELPDERYLTRILTKTGYVYRVSEVRNKAIVATGSLPIGKGDHRRLRYGIDALAHRPVRVIVSQTNQQMDHFELENALPVAEHRLFSALGRVRPKQSDKYYPRVWDIPTSYAQQARQALAELRVQLIEKEPGNKR